MVVFRTLGLVVGGLFGIATSNAALAQAPAPPAEAPPVSPPPPAAALPPEAPPPVAAPPAAAPPVAAAVPVAVPQGYMLVPVSSEQSGVVGPATELPYEEGDPIPPGYRVRNRTRNGLVIAGSIVTGVPWAFSVTGAVAADFDDKSGFLLIPALGPWLMLLAGGAKDDCSSVDADYYGCDDNSGLRATLVLDGLAQTAGAVMFIAGVTIPRKRLVREYVSVGVTPTRVGRDGYGMGVVGSF